MLVSTFAVDVEETVPPVRPGMHLKPPRPGEKANGCGLSFLLRSSLDMTSTNWPHSPTRPDGADWERSRGDMAVPLCCSPFDDVWEKQGLMEPVSVPLTLLLLRREEVGARWFPEILLLPWGSHSQLDGWRL